MSFKRRPNDQILIPQKDLQDVATERVIDAIDFLRSEMLRNGTPCCVGILDDAFNACLKSYIVHKYNGLRNESGQAD